MERRQAAGRWLTAAILCSVVTTSTHASVSRIAPDVSSVHITSKGKTLFGRLFSPALESAQSKAPSVFMLHGIPGTEQNFDVAYALRDAGFNCLLWHYRGCWGSEGSYSIDGLPDDIESALRSRYGMPCVKSCSLLLLLQAQQHLRAPFLFVETCLEKDDVRALHTRSPQTADRRSVGSATCFASRCKCTCCNEPQHSLLVTISTREGHG